MIMKKVLLLFGGKSAEYEISLRSAQTFYKNLDRSRYDVTTVVIDKNTGVWYRHDGEAFFDRQQFPAAEAGQAVYAACKSGQAALYVADGDALITFIDVALPVMHGPFGEDGRIQGFLSLLGIPFVGCDLLSSACALDKEVSKILFNHAGIKTAAGVAIRRGERNNFSYAALSRQYGPVLFVKPANMGSSVGVSRVADAQAFEKALDEAFCHDSKVIIEEEIIGREIECAVLGNDDNAEASLIGEIKTQEFYTYEEKYHSSSKAELLIPAVLPEALQAQVQRYALKAYRALYCEGLARVDMFLLPDNTLLLNEINTMPGFTSISMYPVLWEKSGLPVPQLLDRLIELAFRR
jgi:D-alanine-D-alanine ligase